MRTRGYTTGGARTGCILGGLLVALCAAPAAAGDWPQILGPHRNGQAVDERDVEPWQAAGLQQLWAREAGQGYAGPAVVGDRVVLFHRVENQERVEALNADTGETLWETDFPATYRGGFNPDMGPRCVPLVDGDRVYLFGAAGSLHCVRLEDGQPVWSRDAYTEFRGQEGYFGAGSSPILVSQRLLVNVGGQRAGLVAFSAETGETMWAATEEGASYSSPTVVTLGGKPVVIFVTRLNVVAVDPHDSRVLFRFPFGQTGPTANAATPLVFEDQLFVSAAYGTGARLARLTPDAAETLWHSDEVMSSQYTTCVYHDGHLYGTHGREDYSNGELRCVDAATGKVCWTVPEVGVAHVILVNDRLLVLNNNGVLRLVAASPIEYQSLAEASLTRNVVRALPAVSRGRFYFRDQRGSGGTLRAVALTR